VNIAPKPGFDWDKVLWGAPWQPSTDHCSYCGKPVGAVPLRMWNWEGWACVFCDDCMRVWWGMESLDDVDVDPEDPDVYARPDDS
jgi:hypothetical protein